MTTGSIDAPRRRPASALVLPVALTALGALPAAIRFEGTRSAQALAFLAYWGASALAVGALALIVRAWSPLPRAWVIVPLTAVLGMGPLGWVAERVHVGTHHRPLGAVAFACVALVLNVVIFVFVHRLLELAGSHRPLVIRLLVASATLSALSLLTRSNAGALVNARVLVDGALLLGSVVLSLKMRPSVLERVPTAAVWGIWVSVSAGGIVASHALGVRAWQNAPLLAGAFGGLGF